MADALLSTPGTKAGLSTRYEYDLEGRRTATIRPLGQRSETHYDAQGRTSYELDAEGNRTDYAYDPLTGWLSEKTYTLGEESTAADTAPVSYTYWPDGQVKDITDGRGTTHHEYDAQGRLKLRRDPDSAAIQYEYDAAGNRSETRTYLPDAAGAPQLIGTTDYTFDAQGRLKTVDDAEVGTTTYFYDAASNLIRTDLPNGVIETRAYDWQNRLCLGSA